MHVWLPEMLYRRAMQVGSYRSKGIEGAVEEHLGVKLEGDLEFRVVEFDTSGHRMYIQIDSTWIQPSRA